MCSRCTPILSRYVEAFKSLVHQGTQSRKRKHVNPYPKDINAIPYRDLKRQNEWLVANVFDSMRNYLYCQTCVVVAFGISKQRLVCLHNVKREKSQHPVVEEERLGDFVLMPDRDATAFMVCWRSLSSSAMVQVRYPHDRHGNAGKVSHSAKRQSYRTSSHSSTPIHNQMAGQRIHQALHTTFSHLVVNWC